MSEEALLTILFMFVVLCITIYNMHSNHLKHKNNLHERKNKNLKEHREKWDWYWKQHDRQLFETGGIQEKPSEAPIPTKKGSDSTYDKFERPSDKTMKSLFGIGREKAPPSEELLEELRDLAKINKTGDNHNDINDTKETYYVVEKFGGYVDGVFTVCTENNVVHEKQLTTTKSLLECDRYESYEQAKEFADQYNCNVRNVIVKVEE